MTIEGFPKNIECGQQGTSHAPWSVNPFFSLVVLLVRSAVVSRRTFRSRLKTVGHPHKKP